MQDYSLDIQTVHAYLQGNGRTEEELFGELTSLINGLIRKMEIQGVIFSDQENIVSDIVYQIMLANDRKVLRSYQGNSKLSTYLWSIVRNKIIDAIRKEKRYYSTVVHRDPLESLDHGGENPTGQAETIIEEHLLGEPPLERFIKYAKWMRELSYSEIIAEAKNEFPGETIINTQRVAYILHTNRNALRKKLKKVGFKTD